MLLWTLDTSATPDLTESVGSSDFDGPEEDDVSSKVGSWIDFLIGLKIALELQALTFSIRDDESTGLKHDSLESLETPELEKEVIDDRLPFGGI